MAKRSKIFSLLLVGIRNFQTALAGSIRIVMSDIMLNKQTIRTSILLLRQRASMISGFQFASSGEQANIVIKPLIV